MSNDSLERLETIARRLEANARRVERERERKLRAEVDPRNFIDNETWIEFLADHPELWERDDAR